MQNKIRPAEAPMNPTKTQTTPHVTRSLCGRTGCIAIYTTENCHLCEAAGRYLKELIKAEGLKEDIINVIDNDFQLNEPNFDEIQSRPAIRVCETVMTGLPDEEKMKNSIRRAASMNCFSEDVE